MSITGGIFNYGMVSTPRRMVKLFDIGGTVYQTMHGATNQRWGFGADTAASKLRGKTLVGARFQIRKTGAPTGLVFGRIYDSGGTLVMTMGSKPAANVSLVADFIDFFGFTYVIPTAATTRIVVEYTGGDASNHIDAQTIGAERFDGTNTLLTWFDGGGWNTSGGEDCGGCLWVV